MVVSPSGRSCACQWAAAGRNQADKFFVATMPCDILRSSDPQAPVTLEVVAISDLSAMQQAMQVASCIPLLYLLILFVPWFFVQKYSE